MVSFLNKTRREQLKRLENLALLPPPGRPRQLASGALAAVGLVAFVLILWPLRLGDGAGDRGSIATTENVDWRGGADDAWRTRSLRAPLGTTDLDHEPTSYTFDEPDYGDEPAAPVLVGLSYRDPEHSLAFLRFDDGTVRVLGVGDEYDGHRLTELERDHVVIDRGAERIRLDRSDDSARRDDPWSGGGSGLPEDAF